MDNIGVVGASYRTTSVDALAEAFLPADFASENFAELARLSGFTEFVYLGTCNRVEFYFRAENRIHTNPLLFHLRRSLDDLTGGRCVLPDDDALYVHFGTAAVRHLFRVTSALDSMMVGEAQIVGQAKEAHERAHQLGLLDGILDQTFHEAFHVAKRVRTETELTRRPVSLVTLVERTLHEHLEATTAPAMILGAGEIAQEAYRLLRAGDAERQVVVANRTPERATAAFGSDPATSVLPLDDALAGPPEVSLVVAAISTEQPVFGRRQAASIRERLPDEQPLLLLDLAMPPAIAPDADQLGGVTLYGIEEMREQAEKNRQLRLAELDRCEALVEHQLDTLRRHLLDRAMGPVARSIHRSFREMADRAVRHSLSRDLSHLGEQDRRAIEKMTAGLVKRLVQVPIKGLKGAAWNHSSAVISNFIRGLGTDDDRTGAGGDSG